MSFDISIACMIDDKLSKSRESFAEHLMHLIDERGITDAQAYKRSNIGRRLFSKIKNIDDLHRQSIYTDLIIY